MADIEIGKSYTLIRPTFIYNGVIIIQNSSVEVLEKNENICKVLYIDREGQPQHIDGITTSDLSE